MKTHIDWLKTNTTTIDAVAHTEKMRILDALTEKDAENERLREQLSEEIPVSRKDLGVFARVLDKTITALNIDDPIIIESRDRFNRLLEYTKAKAALEAKMPTIKELYDLGQRQFPMRGGGISPVLEYRNDNDSGYFIVVNDFDFWIWDIYGNHGVGEPALDILPEPLTDTTTKLEALVKAWNALDWEVKETGRLDNPNLLAIIHNPEALIALHDAAVKAAGGQ